MAAGNKCRAFRWPERVSAKESTAATLTYGAVRAPASRPLLFSHSDIPPQNLLCISPPMYSLYHPRFQSNPYPTLPPSRNVFPSRLSCSFEPAGNSYVYVKKQSRKLRSATLPCLEPLPTPGFSWLAKGVNIGGGSRGGENGGVASLLDTLTAASVPIHS